MRFVAAVAAILRRLRAERGIALFLFLLVTVTGFVVAAAPRLFNSVADEGLRYEVEQGSAIGRNLQLSRIDHLPADPDDPFARVAARGRALQGQLPAGVQALVDHQQFVVEAPRFLLTDPPRYRTFVTLRYQQGLEEQVRLTGGRWPVALEPDPADATGEPAPPAFEIAISADTADEIGATVGDRFAANIDPGDPLLANLFPRPSGPAEVTVVGTFTPHDPDAPYWFDDVAPTGIGIGGSDEEPIAFASGIVAPEAYPDVLALGLPLRYTWRTFLDADRLDAANVDALVEDLRRMETAFSTTGTVRAGSTLLRSGLPDLVDRYLRQRTTSEAALSVAALGPATVAAGALGLIGILLVRRRRPALLLMRGRGASGGQLLAAQAWEGLVLTVPAAFLGLVLAEQLVPARASHLSGSGALLVAIAATVLLVAATWPIAGRTRQAAEREDVAVVRLSPRRLVVELTVVLLALVATWLLRERGLGGSAGGDAGPRGFDPFLAAAPLLTGFAVGVLLLRVYPIPIRGLAWLTSRRRDLVPVLGLRNLGRNPSAGYLPLLILSLTVAVGTFSSVVQSSIETSQDDVAWQEVGADYRIEARSAALPDGLDVAGVPGVEAAAAAVVMDEATVSTGPGRRFDLRLQAINPPAYEAVVAGTPAALAIPDWFTPQTIGSTIGTLADPLPAVISARRPAGSDPVAVGDTLDLVVSGATVTVLVGGVSERFPGIPAGEPFLIVPLEPLRVAADRALAPNVVFVRGPADLARALGATLGPDGAAGTLVSRYARFAALHDAPLVAAVVGGFAVALIVAGVYAALSVVAVVMLHAQRRTRDMAYLRTLGLSDRQGVLLLLIEYGLPMAIALGVGIGLGLALAWLLAPGLDLAAFSRAGTTVLLALDWPAIALVALGVTAVVSLAIATASRIVRRLDVGTVLRGGDA